MFVSKIGEEQSSEDAEDGPPELLVCSALFVASSPVVSSKQTKPCAFFEVISHSRILYEAMQLKKGTKDEKCFEN